MVKTLVITILVVDDGRQSRDIYIIIHLLLFTVYYDSLSAGCFAKQ